MALKPVLCSKRLATFWDTEKDQAMRHGIAYFMDF